MRPHLLQLALLLPSGATAAALAGPPQSRRRTPPPKPSAADASPAAAENAVLQVELPTPLRITYATESSCVESWLCARQHEPAFGFDTETRPAFRKGEVFAPATLRLSTATDCLVVHLAHLEAPFPAALVEVLASPDALMCGLGIDDDAIELWLHHGLEVYGRVELLSMPGASKGSSLAGLSEALLGARLGKSKRLTMTRWPFGKSKARRTKVWPEWRRASLSGLASARGCPRRHLGAASLSRPIRRFRRAGRPYHALLSTAGISGRCSTTS